ncbi:enkurin-like isoform X1 [Scophthalmus maximus]|uniref:enkurin-like isoform X1 n=1 Tax=Scophthalmus maximus TaxID=52904 RepID=UPI001FA81F11|nr:enkurin-like isoform X1 [Scophthalmus maximus]XP_047183599.1 enkurin-like isoform X1 [Scophthalmus maximus]
MKSSNMVEAMNPPEGIYIQIQKPTVPRYVSKFRPTLESMKKEARRTMGPAKVEVSVPDKYLKKHSKEPKLPEISSKFVRTNCSGKKPAVPARTGNAPVDIQTKRDQESTTGECTQTTKVAPKKPEPIFVDTRKGHKQPIENSGLVPKHINKKNFGAVPGYVLQRNEEKQRAREEFDKFLKQQQEQEAKKKWTDAEQKNILKVLEKTIVFLKGLKSWEKSHPEFQSLPTIRDLISQNKNRERVDMEMKKLEDEINLVERFKTTYLPEHENKTHGLRFTQLFFLTSPHLNVKRV